MNAFKRRCVDLRKAGYTLPEIVKETGRPKTSVYAHIYNIPLSQEKLLSIKLASGIRAKAIGLARKGKSIRNFKRFTQWDKNNVILLAHLIFDGTINRTSCIYNNRNIPLVEMVEYYMKDIYDYEPKRYFNKKTGVSRISYHNVTLGTYLQDKSHKLLRDIYQLPKALKREFVKAFFDDEGCIDFRPRRNLRQVRGYQKDVKILMLTKFLLEEFDISAKVVQPNEVVITGKENLEKFQREINFTVGVRINGERLNSIWKKSLEKRTILDQAIKSFKH